LRHSHIWTYDEIQASAENLFWDNAEDKQGLKKTMELINGDVSLKLADTVLGSSINCDNILVDFLEKSAEGSDDVIAKNSLVRACSEAIMYAVAKCYSVNNVYDGFKESFYPYDEDVDITRNTKLLISVFNGGKAANSVVKFTKFYLIVDAAAQGGPDAAAKIDPIRILGFYQKFLATLKKAIMATKVGEAGFKLGVDGVYFNANANIAESFKMIEEAIVLSGANDDGRKLFQIGVNADADSGYNKDAKDPGKYEQEGQKTQFGVEAMIEYYTKMLQEHPLLTYLEDAFGQFDFGGHKELKEKLQNEFPTVNMGLRQVFKTGGFARLK